MNGGNPAVPDNDEISPGVSWRLTRTARSPSDPPAIAQFLGPGNRLISKVRVSRPDRARDAIDLVAATVDAPRLVEHAIFGEDLVDRRAAARGVVFTEDVVKIAGQQGRHAVGHGLPPLGSLLRGRASPRPRRFPDAIQAGWVLPGGGRDGLTAIVSAREPQRSTFDRSTLECFGFPRCECSAGES